MCRCGTRLEPAKAHNRNGTTAPRGKTFALPNIMTAVRAGDFEAVTTYRIGPAKRSRGYTVFTLTDPARVVVDVRAAFPTIQRRVYFFLGFSGISSPIVDAATVRGEPHRD